MKLKLWQTLSEFLEPGSFFFQGLPQIFPGLPMLILIWNGKFTSCHFMLSWWERLWVSADKLNPRTITGPLFVMYGVDYITCCCLWVPKMNKNQYQTLLTSSSLGHFIALVGSLYRVPCRSARYCKRNYIVISFVSANWHGQEGREQVKGYFGKIIYFSHHSCVI